jgi:hypothetical protein
MRCIILLLLGSFIASCTTAPPPPSRSARAETHYQQLLAGKVPQAPVSCLPSYNANDMIVVDENTVAFRVSASRLYVTHMQGPCNGLSPGGPYALLTRQFGSAGLCRGDIAQVIDTVNHFTVGSCTFGEFTPYVRPGR